MAFSVTATLRCPSLCKGLLKNSRSVPQAPTSISFRSSTAYLSRTKPLSIRCASIQAAPPTSGGVTPAIALTDDALKHLNKMRSERNEDLCLRIGVKQGGCSGMSYTMEFENRGNQRPDDSIIEYNGFVIVCDPKSLLFLYGMQLDYSDALIGGGFGFKNPNATQTCGCGAPNWTSIFSHMLEPVHVESTGFKPYVQGLGQQGDFTFHARCQELEHFQVAFADDLFIVGGADKHQWFWHIQIPHDSSWTQRKIFILGDIAQALIHGMNGKQIPPTLKSEKGKNRVKRISTTNDGFSVRTARHAIRSHQQNIPWAKIIYLK
ncbi:unnamed protein product [Camellia sinensis]